MASNKNLKYFMRDNTNEVITVPGPDSFRDENGNVLNLEIKVLSQADIMRINDNYRHKTVAVDKKGKPLSANGSVLWKEERDSAKASRHIIVEALQFPDLKDKELMDYYHCVDVTDMPLLVFSRPEEYVHVTTAVMTALGLMDKTEDDELVENAKNS